MTPFQTEPSSMLQLLIVDDEPLARERLKRLTAHWQEYKLCGEAENGEEALQLISLHHPDIVLMDVRMPVMDGLVAAERITHLQHPPAVIFCTAYNDYAIAAFKVQASDYLLKPVRKEALQEALSRTRKLNKIQFRQAKAEQPESSQQHKTPTLVARSPRGSKLIELDTIFYFLANQKYVTVYHKNGETLVDYTLKDLEQQFPQDLLRIHRNTLINKGFLDALNKRGNSKYHIKLRHVPEELVVSRRHLPEVKACIEQNRIR